MSSKVEPNLADQRYQHDLLRIAESIRIGKCVLFLGAAIHSASPPNCPYRYHKRPLTGQDLANLLAAECSYPKSEDRRNLQRIAWYHEWFYKSRHALVSTVREAIHRDHEPSPVLRGLARLEFPVVVTTNYDQLYEKALIEVARESRSDKLWEPRDLFTRSIYSPESKPTMDCPARPSRKKPYLLKIHGDIGRSSSIVITDEDYIQFVLRMGDSPRCKPVGEKMMRRLKEWPTLFIGYRLQDYNLRMLFKSLRWKIDPADYPDTYSVDPQPDVLIRDVWQDQRRYVRFIEKNLWDFVPDLYQAVTGENMPQ